MKSIRLISIAIFLLLTINMISASDIIFYKVYAEYNNEKLIIRNVDVVYSQQNLEDNFGNYSFEIKDQSGKILKKGVFNVPKILVYDNGENGILKSGGETSLDRVSFETYIPYDKNGKEIILYNRDNKQIAKKDISIYAKDKVIINQEDKNTEQQISFQEIEERAVDIAKNPKVYIWLLIIVVVILAIIIFKNLKKKK